MPTLRQKLRRRANRRLKGEPPRKAMRTSYPSVGELLVWHMNPKYWYRDMFGIWKRR